ncbi:hypothetical protein [Priestia megaterium]|uniref:hypothetical protein n=1 Tax=Priestia megaterium TaxID=1404 RepID=UPI000BF860FE|nr:hypothetical protein [Priestia megaterium]PFW43763.1 hypothetical protein COL17_26510 [Priestia megaterium]
MNIKEIREEFEDKLERLEKIAIQLSNEDRVKLVDDLLEEFMEKTGGRKPDTNSLIRLSNVILIEDIKDRTPDKVRLKEYPFLSDRQIITRKKREHSLEEDTIDFLHQKEVKKMDSAFKKRTQNKDE